MVEKYLSETDIKKLLQCSRCKRVPLSPPIYMCKTGHHECSACYGKNFESIRIEETDGSTDTESESGSARKGENGVGIIFSKTKKFTRKHTCALCKDEVTNTRNLFAECLLNQLDVSKHDSRLDKTGFIPSMKINVQETKVQTNYVDCCYNIYGSPCQRFDDETVPIPTFEPQGYTRYPIPCNVPQYNFTMNPYVVTETAGPMDYNDPGIFTPNYESVGFYSYPNRKETHERKSKYNFQNQCSVVSLNGESSKRPIRCPTHLCGRNIAVAALSSHFCFDHPDVPPINVDFDVNCHLFIDPEMVPLNYPRCVAILLIPNKCEAISSTSHPSIVSLNKIKNSLPLIVMASRLDCSTVMPSSIAGLHEESPTESLNHGDFQTRGIKWEVYKHIKHNGLSVLHNIGSEAYELTHGSRNLKSNLLVVWLAGVDTNSSLFTTIQVTEKQSNSRSMIYTGPIMSLRGSQNTNKVFEQGDCLVIHSGILENIVGDKGGFDLHVVVH